MRYTYTKDTPLRCRFCGKTIPQSAITPINDTTTARCPKCLVVHAIIDKSYINTLLEDDEYWGDNDYVYLLRDKWIRGVFCSAWGLDPESISPEDYYSDSGYIDISALGDDIFEGDLVVYCWEKDELLTTKQVAKILGTTTDWASRLAREKVLKGSRRASVSKKGYKKGRWLVPRGIDRSTGDIEPYGLYDYLTTDTMSMDEKREIIAETLYHKHGRKWEAVIKLARGRIDKLLNSLIVVTDLIGHDVDKGLAYPSLILDLIIIFQAKVEYASYKKGWVIVDNDALLFDLIPKFTCPERWYLFAIASEYFGGKYNSDFTSYSDYFENGPTAIWTQTLEWPDALSLAHSTLDRLGFTKGEMWCLKDDKPERIELDLDDDYDGNIRNGS